MNGSEMKLRPLIQARIQKDYSLWDMLRVALCYKIMGERLSFRLMNLIADIEKINAT